MSASKNQQIILSFMIYQEELDKAHQAIADHPFLHDTTCVKRKVIIMVNFSFHESFHEVNQSNSSFYIIKLGAK